MDRTADKVRGRVMFRLLVDPFWGARGRWT